MEALIAELGELQVPELPEYEPDEAALGEDRNTAFYEVLDAYGCCLRLGDLDGSTGVVTLLQDG